MSATNTITTAIHLLGVLRLSDRTVLSSYAPSATSSSFPPSLLRELAATHPTLRPYKRQTEEGPDVSIHFFLDDQGLLYACVTDKSYPSRVIFALLEETRQDFASRHNALKVPEGERERGQGVFAKQDKKWLKELVGKYKEPATVDELYAVSEKVEVTRGIMQESIATLLQNDEKLQSQAQATESLTHQAKTVQCCLSDQTPLPPS
ncbi:hypothetical protein VYU27_008918, partial [Nannochloropsis oceanica]